MGRHLDSFFLQRVLPENAYSVFFREDNWGILKPYQLAVVGTMVPTVTYMMKF